MARYQHRFTGATRVSTRKLGYPWEEIAEEAEGLGKKSKAELVELAAAAGLETSGTKAELVAALEAHAAETA